MAQFELGRFTEGRVVANGWYAPKAGERVYLSEDASGNLVVARDPSEGDVAYTWPRGRSNAEAARLAWRHHERSLKAAAR
jgi:hypothetical protein